MLIFKYFVNGNFRYYYLSYYFYYYVNGGVSQAIYLEVMDSALGEEE